MKNKTGDQGHAHKETVDKAKVGPEKVPKHEPLSKQKPIKPTAEQVRQLCEICDLFLAEGLVEKTSSGELSITALGKRTCRKLEKLVDNGILQFMEEAGRPVREAEIEEYLAENDDAFFAEALRQAKEQSH